MVSTLGENPGPLPQAPGPLWFAQNPPFLKTPWGTPNSPKLLALFENGAGFFLKWDLGEKPGFGGFPWKVWFFPNLGWKHPFFR